MTHSGGIQGSTTGAEDITAHADIRRYKPGDSRVYGVICFRIGMIGGKSNLSCAICINLNILMIHLILCSVLGAPFPGKKCESTQHIFQ